MSGISGHDRAWLYVCFVVLLALAAAVSAISVRDPDGALLRVGMVLMVVGAAMWLPLPLVALAVPAVWLGPNFLRGQMAGEGAFTIEALMELPGLAGIALASAVFRARLRMIEDESRAFHAPVGLESEIDIETGVFHQAVLYDAVERELVRSRRFGREFALMLAGVDGRRLKYDYREPEKWQAALQATARLLSNTRTHIDRVHRYGECGFALLLPETGPKEIGGLVRRLARSARRASPAEGEPGGPLPLHFGVTFFPQCATTVDDLLRRAEVAQRLAEKNPNRIQLDGAEAPDLPSPEMLRREEEEEEAALEALSGKWLGAEAPDEESPSLPEREPLAVSAIQSSVFDALHADLATEPQAIGSESTPPVISGLPSEQAEAAGQGFLAEAAPDADISEVHELPASPAASRSLFISLDCAEPLVREVTVALCARNAGREVSRVENGTVPGPAAGAAPDAGVDGMLKRLNETLAMIRGLKERAAA